jgi:hypothetical protein
MKRLFFLLALTVAPSPAFGQVIWENVRAGMTVAQVRAVQPTARVPRVRGTVRELGGGPPAVCELEIQGTVVAGQVFDTCFYMAGGRLVQVMSAARRPSRSLVEVLKAHFRSRYGMEVESRRDPCSTEDFLTMCEWNWRLRGGVEINLAFGEVADEGSELSVNYRRSP